MDLTKIEEAAKRQNMLHVCHCPTCASPEDQADEAILIESAPAMIAEIKRLTEADAAATAMLNDAAEKIGRLMMQVERLKTLAREGWEAARDAWDAEDWGDGKRIDQALKEIEANESEDAALGDIITERRAQDAKWGGPAHDDRHDAEDWIDRMARKLEQAHDLIGGEHSNDYIFRRRMVQVGALAVACVESLDRHCGKNGGVVR